MPTEWGNLWEHLWRNERGLLEERKISTLPLIRWDPSSKSVFHSVKKLLLLLNLALGLNDSKKIKAKENGFVLQKWKLTVTLDTSLWTQQEIITKYLACYFITNQTRHYHRISRRDVFHRPFHILKGIFPFY